MSIARDFDDFKEEIELAFAQNACVEIELYSIIASVIRESKNKQKLSIRDVSSRKRSEISAKFYGLSGFPDFVLLERKKDQDAVIYGCIEAKMPTIALGDNDEQLLNLRCISTKYKNTGTCRCKLCDFFLMLLVIIQKYKFRRSKNICLIFKCSTAVLCRR